MKIELYVQGKTKNPARQKKAQASWLISCALSNGTIEHRDGLVTLNHATTKRAVLCALIEALKIFNKAAVIKIYISDDFVRAVLINGLEDGKQMAGIRSGSMVRSDMLIYGCRYQRDLQIMESPSPEAKSLIMRHLSRWRGG